MAREVKPWSDRDIRRRCKQLREQLAVAAVDVVSPDELAAYWPGGAENAIGGRGAWLWCWAQYIRLCDRMRPAHAAIDADEAERARSDAQQDLAVAVTLDSGHVVSVHPLGYVALEFLTTLDRSVTGAAELAAAVALHRTPASEQALALEPLYRSFAVQVWAWVLTAGTAELPFDPLLEQPDPPAWTHAMTPADLLKLFTAHRQVNAQRNLLVASLFPQDTQASVRLSLAGFIGAYAHEKGKDAATYMRRFSIGKLFAQAVSAAQQHEAARQAAERKSGRDGLDQIEGLG